MVTLTVDRLHLNSIENLELYYNLIPQDNGIIQDQCTATPDNYPTMKPARIMTPTYTVYTGKQKKGKTRKFVRSGLR